MSYTNNLMEQIINNQLAQIVAPTPGANPGQGYTAPTAPNVSTQRPLPGTVSRAQPKQVTRNSGLTGTWQRMKNQPGVLTH